MKVSKKVMALTLATSVVLAGGVFATSSNASTGPEKEAEYVVKKYMNAVVKGDVETAVQYSKDIRYPNMEEAKKEYKVIVQQNPVKKAEVLAVKQIDENNMVATIKLSARHVVDQQVDLPLIKENGEWKVYVTGQNVEANAR